MHICGQTVKLGRPAQSLTASQALLRCVMRASSNCQEFASHWSPALKCLLTFPSGAGFQGWSSLALHQARHASSMQLCSSKFVLTSNQDQGIHAWIFSFAELCMNMSADSNFQKVLFFTKFVIVLP